MKKAGSAIGRPVCQGFVCEKPLFMTANRFILATKSHAFLRKTVL
jgi:hypothetical protein